MSTQVLSLPERVAASARWRDLRRRGRLFARSASSVAGLAIVLLFLLVTAIGPWIVPYPEDARGAVHLEQQAPGAERRPLVRHRRGRQRRLHARDPGRARVAADRPHHHGDRRAHRRAARHRGRLRRRPRCGELIMRVTDVFLSVPALRAGARRGRRARPGHPQRHDRAVAGVVAGLRAAGPGQDAGPQAARRTSRRRARVGTGRLRIVFVHILPNCVSPIMVKASMDMGTAILAAASLGLHRPRRPAAVSGVGRDDQPRAQLPADVVVVLGVPGRWRST